MDKGILRNFAINARNDLEERIENKINSYFIDEKFTIEQRGDLYYLNNDDHSLTLSSTEYEKRELLIKRIDELTLERVIEEAAYTWFNRLIAVRYMEIHDYLPLTKNNLGLGIRVLSSSDNQFDPEILKYQNLINSKLDINFNKNYYEKISHDNDKFKYVLDLITNKMKQVIPQVFGGVTDYVDVLLPDNLLNEDSFIHSLIVDIPEIYFNNVEIIGWLYQYYNQTKKDEVISAKKTYKKHEIAYATQIFTPDWIVKYMVQNSLGKYWIEHSNVNNDHLIESWEYFINDNIVKSIDSISPEEITFIDPSMGSGHILVYAFDMFYQIYLAAGYPSQAIPSLIISKNLFGLDIDDRAGQLSVLSILLKSREFDKDIFNKKQSKNLNIISIQELNNLDEFSVNSLPQEFQLEIDELIKEYSNAKEIGSLLLGTKNDYDNLINQIDKSDFIIKSNLMSPIEQITKQNKILNSKYNIVVTNPPYINNRLLSNNVREVIKQNFKDGRPDIFSAFMIRNIEFSSLSSYIGFMTPNVWLFLSSYTDLRNNIISSANIDSLIKLAKGSFFSEATVDIVSFILKNDKDLDGVFISLEKYKSNLLDQEKGLIKEINSKKPLNKINNNNFLSLPGNIINFPISDNLISIFKDSKHLMEFADAKQGMATGNNNKYLRQWYEVSIKDIKLQSTSREESIEENAKYVPYNKGGQFRKWYGNNDYVIYFKDFGKSISQSRASRFQNSNFYFLESISWSKISSGDIAFRYKPFGHVFDVAGCSVFTDNKEMSYYLLALANSVVIKKILSVISPTLNYEVGHISSLPVVINKEHFNEITKYSSENIILAKEDWDLDELSWDFKTHPFINESRVSHFGNIGGNDHSLEHLYDHLKTTIQMRFDKLKENEEIINRKLIKTYDLENELNEDVVNKDITVTKLFDSALEIYPEIKGNKYIKTKEDIVKSFISYFVGCLFGRYSLDQDGIIFAGGNFNYGDYKKFEPLKDNIIPITDNKYFAEDIVYKFLEFIEILFSKETLNENVEFIANTLGKKDLETDVETIRRYFINDFYRDHVQTYKKKPIYWLFNSGKDDGFKGLMYIHRYDENLIPKIRLDYVHAMQNIYQRELEEVKYKLSTDLVLTEKKNLQDREVDLNKKIVELNNYDELIAHAANQRITLDLDDGIDVNYDKLKELLAKK